MARREQRIIAICGIDNGLVKSVAREVAVGASAASEVVQVPNPPIVQETKAAPVSGDVAFVRIRIESVRGELADARGIGIDIAPVQEIDERRAAGLAGN